MECQGLKFSLIAVTVTDDIANEEDSLSGGDRSAVHSGPAELSLNSNLLKRRTSSSSVHPVHNKDIRSQPLHRCTLCIPDLD